MSKSQLSRLQTHPIATIIIQMQTKPISIIIAIYFSNTQLIKMCDESTFQSHTILIAVIELHYDSTSKQYMAPQTRDTGSHHSQRARVRVLQISKAASSTTQSTC